ncbi:DnaJ C-terminal domain-containing protein [Vibrio sp. PP-XX7]
MNISSRFIAIGQVEHLTKHLKVKIPSGMSDGERIRVAGQGKPSENGGASGDLYIHIRLVPHPLFDVQGHNLIIYAAFITLGSSFRHKSDCPDISRKNWFGDPANTRGGAKITH